MSRKIWILIYEKDENLGSLLREYLEMHEYEVHLFADIALAYESFVANNYSLCILDINENQLNELEMGQKMKLEKDEVAIIYMSTKPSLALLSAAYHAGADDFVRKPFILEELRARIHVILRRIQGVKLKEITYYQIGKYLFDTRKRTLASEDSFKSLTTKECSLLTVLCENANQIVERAYALRCVWKCDSYFSARSMDVYITKLRKLLAGDPNICIINIHGHGYKLSTHDNEM